MPETYDTSTALVVVDVQNDFADPSGGLYVREGEQVVQAANAEIDAATAAGAPVFYTQDWHPATTPHFQKDGGVWPVHCVAETWGAELHPGLRVAGPVVRKGVGGEDGYSGFTMRDPESGETQGTGLEELVRAVGAERLVVLGLAGDVCVKATALDGAALGWPVVVPWAATRSVELQPGDDAAARAELIGRGITVR
ncbi:MAG: nicotinamidase/pyrazinamidase [Frankiaceae bacterium]|nr:nicotinamidase/pyrazinamidase [Frankiaceae bacterium]